MTTRTNHLKRYKIGFLLLGIIALLILVYNFRIAEKEKYNAYGDAYDYIQLAISISKNGEFGFLKVPSEAVIEDLKNNQLGSKTYTSAISAFRPPVWPILMAGVFSIFGYNLTFILIFKFLIHLIGTYIFFKCLKMLDVHLTLTLLGTFLYCISPSWQLYSRTFLSEPITLFFITTWLFFLLRHLKNETPIWPQGLIAGILILSHPYFIFLPFSIWFSLFLFKKINLKKMVIAALLCCGIISLWVIRNSVVFETSDLVLTTSSGAVMAKGWNKEVPKEHSNTQGDLADENLVLENFKNDHLKYNTEIEKLKLYQKATFHFIKDHPRLIFPIISKKLISAFNPFPEKPKPGILETGRVFYQLMALLSMIYFLFFSKNEIGKSLALGLLLSTIGITIMTYSGFRFRMPQGSIELTLLFLLLNEIFNNKFTVFSYKKNKKH